MMSTVLPWSAAVVEHEFQDPQLVRAPHRADLEVDLRWIQSPPLAEIVYTFEPLARLRELKDCILVIDLMGDVAVSRAVVKIVLQRGAN